MLETNAAILSVCPPSLQSKLGILASTHHPRKKRTNSLATQTYSRRQDKNGKEVFQSSSFQHELPTFDDSVSSSELQQCTPSQSTTKGKRHSCATCDKLGSARHCLNLEASENPIKCPVSVWSPSTILHVMTTVEAEKCLNNDALGWNERVEGSLAFLKNAARCATTKAGSHTCNSFGACALKPPKIS